MRFILRHVVDSPREIDLPHRLVRAIGEKLRRLYRVSENLNWHEAERHQAMIAGEAPPLARGPELLPVGSGATLPGASAHASGPCRGHSTPRRNSDRVGRRALNHRCPSGLCCVPRTESSGRKHRCSRELHGSNSC